MKIEARSIRKSFGDPPQEVLHGIDFVIESGEFVALTGRSGSGKSTLLYVMSTLDRPTDGKVLFDDEDATLWDSKKVHLFRNEKLGFVFQFHYLLPELSALENILLPSMKKKTENHFKRRALDLLEIFGIADKAHRLPGQLSGGEQQRVAIARSMILKPRIIFADEPTGNLDSYNGDLVMDEFKKIHREEKTTLVLITHEPAFAKQAERQIHLVDGRIGQNQTLS